MPPKRAITACLVIRNESSVLERCLKSIQSIVTHIIVVHDGPCSDESLSICKKFHARVVVRPTIGEAEPHRAWLLTQVRTPFVLQIDADEFLSAGLQQAIPLALMHNADGYTAIWPYWDGKMYRTQGWPKKLFLYRLRAISYLASPHEVVQVRGQIHHIPHVLEHRPTYNNLSFAIFRSKWLPWARVHASFYLRKKRQIQRFGDPTYSLTPQYANLMALSPLSTLPLGLYHFWGTYLRGGISQGTIGLKSCLLMAVYYMIVSLNVAKLRYAPNQ